MARTRKPEADSPPPHHLGSLGERGAEGLSRVLARVGVRAPWDLLLVGDGSGDWRHDTGCGYACVAVDRASRRREVFFGAHSHGSTHDAELQPYYQALLWHSRTFRPAGRAANAAGRRCRVAVVCDNAQVVTEGCNIAARPELIARCTRDQPLWSAILTVQATAGYDLSWHFMDRAQSGLNVLCDLISRAARQAVSADDRLRLVDRHVRDRYALELGALAAELNRLEHDEPGPAAPPAPGPTRQSG